MKGPQWRVPVAAALILGAACWVVGARVGAGLVHGQLQMLLAGTTSQVLLLDHLRFNPFTLTAKFDALHLSDAASGPVLTAAAGRLRLAFTGLFDNTIAVSDLSLDQPRLVVSVSGTSGNRQLKSLGRFQPAATGDRKHLPVRVARARITNGHVTVYDAPVVGTQRILTGIEFRDVNVQLSRLFSDEPTAASFDLAAQINETGALTMRGNWTPSRRAGEAAVQLSGVELTPFATAFNAGLADVQLAGVLTAHGRLRHRDDNFNFEGEVTIDELSADGTQGDAMLSANRLIAHGLMIDTRRPNSTIQWLELERAGIAVHLGDDGQLNLRRFMVDPFPQINKVTVHDGYVSFTDARFPSSVQIDASKIAGEFTSSVDGPRQRLAVNLAGTLADQGTATLGGVFHVNDGQLLAEGEVTVAGSDASIVSAYVSNWTAREITAGVLDLDLHYRMDATGLVMFNKVALADLELGAPAADAPASGLPVELTVALLTDENGRMVFELPVNSPVKTGEAVSHEVGNALRDFMTATAAEPMNTLMQLAGPETGNIGRIEFSAGSTEVPPSAEHQIAALVNALDRRPLLGLRVQGHYSAGADRKVLARRQVGLHVALAASSRTGDSPEQTGLDFTDPKIQAVLDEFADARLDSTERTTLSSSPPDNSDTTETAAGTPNYPAVFEALAAKESVSDYALRQLARYRAHSLAGRLQEMGIEPQRLEVDKKAAPMESDDAPPVVALTPIAHRQSDEKK